MAQKKVEYAYALRVQHVEPEERMKGRNYLAGDGQVETFFAVENEPPDASQFALLPRIQRQ